MFAHLFRKRKIRQYARKLSRDLLKHYGKKRYYSRNQLERALIRQKLRRPARDGDSNGKISTNEYYAYAMYCSPAEFSRISMQTSIAQGSSEPDYGQLRREAAEVIFGRPQDFSITSLHDASTDHSAAETAAAEPGCDSGSD
ncbi:DUF6559 family protein [Shewanella algae]|uniref:DUF6559 family protein n=1 Tax=Shewanella algae TaxID=38313 RepID=UPI001AADC821|nr:DUF6559 family protein [Shewanella algae]MBO2577698.1 hypothetical protein [Shewanella algae]MBO2683313.1 hypothetical protein [Shewanella algae]BCV60915.1 hypothetical protein TUM17386_05860 [Shewanella algae]